MLTLRRSSTSFAALLTLALAGAMWAPSVAHADPNVLFIFDASGSMKKAVDGEPRIDVAKRAMISMLAEMPAGVNIGLMLYGARRAKDCTDIDLVSPIGADDAGRLAQQIEQLEAKGETPIADAILRGARSFAPLAGQSNAIVLVTDGIEECRGDPCAAAAAVKRMGVDLKVNIVGFTLEPKQRAAIECVVRETGGTYYDASDAGELVKALGEVREQVAEASPPAPQPEPKPEDPRINLISPAEGGGPVVTPNDVWLATADDQESSVTWMRDGQEAVYGFKDDGPGTFDTFTVLINGSGAGNPKEIELSASDDSPTGPFRPIATCTFQDVKLTKTPYQPCKFDKTTARYVKAKILSSYGDSYVVATEWQILGELGGDLAPAAAAQPAASPTAINLISPAEGGGPVVTPNDVWLATADDAEDSVTWMRDGQEAVYGFKDEGPATFDTFTVLVKGSGEGNPKEIELSASDDSLSGPFRPVATCTFQDVKLTKTPYQPCKFDKTTARYVKAKILSSYGDSYVVATEWQILGEAAE